MFQILNYQFILKQKKGGESMKRKNLVKLRVELGLKSQEMAEEIGFSRQHYSNIENGKVDPTFGFIEKLEQLCAAKGIVVEDIWELFKKAE
jgi:DNA-binding XRE family transcriptional regulator